MLSAGQTASHSVHSVGYRFVGIHSLPLPAHSSSYTESVLGSGHRLPEKGGSSYYKFMSRNVTIALSCGYNTILEINGKFVFGTSLFHHQLPWSVSVRRRGLPGNSGSIP